MVRKQIEARGVRDPRVLAAMRTVPRHRFMPKSQRSYAYDDRPLPIGEGQTISQPYIVALMSELADLEPGDKVLEVGTGSGYQAAVLAEMGVKVYSIEIIEPLAKRAKAVLEELGYGKRVEVRHGDGYAGWPEQAPFDAVIVTAAPPKIPEPLKQQLEVGGRLVIPVGKYFQSLLRVTRTKDGFREESVIPVRFVPMTGKAQEK
ncbi:MAG: protein-L-isoaspartate O-methyltransferase [Myxococcales bacterium SG8_38]|nr:MAG: protein-L-isoaspartate O-methyltransferase [Myxococcales bacterium SG8_38]